MDHNTPPLIDGSHTSTADKIRTMNLAGVATSEIAALLGIRYQHAYNVLRKAGRIVPRSKVPA